MFFQSRNEGSDKKHNKFMVVLREKLAFSVEKACLFYEICNKILLYWFYKQIFSLLITTHIF